MGNVRFHSYEEVRERAEEAFRGHHARLSSLLPYADIQHVGSTAIPGARTKGDLDIQVRVPPGRFAEAERLAEYDALKARWEGRPMDAYREEKAAFFERLLGSVESEG
ncbi:GrpB family protein [Archangium violaceum]|uniref:GrpB family protein n=1 Tax=Archangium violaceum TaxID=83451 RepID=UPI0036DC1DD8